MLTPQEIQDKKFEKALLGGYDMSQVDTFLDQVLADYSSLYKENATLKSKMRVLVDKIEEYRAVDDEMRKALYNAQITAQEIESKARREAEDMIRAAKENAAATMRDLQLEIERETCRLEEAKRLCDQFGQKMQAALTAGSRELEALLQKPADQFQTAAPAAENRRISPAHAAFHGKGDDRRIHHRPPAGRIPRGAFRHGGHRAAAHLPFGGNASAAAYP